MTINQIKYVLAIAKNTSMRAAAEDLFISQPALSSAVGDLEEELGICIFERSNRGIKITEEGKEFINYAKKAANQFEILEERYVARDKDKARFSVSAQHYSFAGHAFAAMINRYNPEKYVFSMHETRTLEVLEDVRDYKSEVGILSYTAGNERVLKKLIKDYQLVFTPLMKKEVYAYFWKEHPLAKREEVSIEELRAYPCISFEQQSKGDVYLNEEALENYDFQKHVKVDDRATSMELVASLGGYSIGSGLLAGEDEVLKGLVSVKLKEDDPITIGYIIKKDRNLSKIGKSYLEELEKYKEL